jgi:hypothetical protein
MRKLVTDAIITGAEMLEPRALTTQIHRYRPAT